MEMKRMKRIQCSPMWQFWWWKQLCILATWHCVLYPRWSCHTKRMDTTGQPVHHRCVLKWETTNQHQWCKRNLVLYCNARKAIINKKGAEGNGTVGFHPEGITNILSLNNVQHKHKVRYDSTLNQCFLVHEADGTIQVFRPSKRGLFFSDSKNDVTHIL